MTKTTQTIIGQKAKEAVYKGVKAIYEPVRLTLGPQAKKALIYRTMNRGSRIVDDGHIVAQVQEPQDPYARLAANVVKEACLRTNEKVGDGTATTAVILGKLFLDVYRLLNDGTSEFSATTVGKIGVSTMRKMILDSANKVKEEIRKTSKTVDTLEDLVKIATISVGDAELGQIIAEMAWKVGVDGFIDVIEGFKGEIETEVIEGMRFPAKPGAKAFVNNPARYEMVVQDCPVLLTNYALDNVGEIGKLFQDLNAVTSKIIVMAPSFSENVLVNMVNATKSGYFIYPVKVPSLRTEQFEDVSIYCGATFIDKAKGKLLRNVKKEDLGFLEKLIVKDTEAKEDAVATGGRGTLSQVLSVYNDVVIDGKKVRKHEEKITTQIAERIEILKGQLKETQQESFKKLLERRIASMGSAVGVIRVADSTQASSLDRKLKIEDAVYACKAALKGGYVKGGGLCLKDISDNLPETDVLKAALRAPYEQIQSSVDGGIPIGADVIDPADAEYYAVEHATSVVANLITVEILVPETEEIPMGEGEQAIARAINEFVISNKIHLGQLKENEAEMERDRMNGLTVDEALTLDKLNN